VQLEFEQINLQRRVPNCPREHNTAIIVAHRTFFLARRFIAPSFSAPISGRENSAPRMHRFGNRGEGGTRVAAKDTLACPGITALLVTGTE